MAKSLSVRLIAISIVWILIALVVTGLLLTFLFRNHIERRFDQELYDHLEELVAAGEVTTIGVLKLSWIPTDPRFNRPRSGWYWQVKRDGYTSMRSKSLWRSQISVGKPAPDGRPSIQEASGPDDEPLRALVQGIRFPATDGPFVFLVAGPVSNIHDDVAHFAGQLAVTLCFLGLGLIIAVLLQVRLGLRPLLLLHQALSDIRAGESQRLPESFPKEVDPVVRELNALLEHNADMLDRARSHAGNLAHALKNPLTVIGNESAEIAGERGRLLREQADIVGKAVDRHLSRARAAGAYGVLGARTPIREIVEDIRFSMSVLYQDRGIDMDCSGIQTLYFAGDARDLEEMIGNLIDNACKWARQKVVVSTTSRDHTMSVVVDDDGPGIPNADRDTALARGNRLDESVPGSGLGLDIVRDLAGLYRGSLTLGVSPLGGLRAVLELPLAS